MVAKMKWRGTEPLWNIDQQYMEMLRFDEFDLTWSYAPSDSPTMAQRFKDADAGLHVGLGALLRKDPFIKYNYRNIDGYHVMDIIPNDMVKEENKDWKILYRYNQDWFRSDHFTKNHDGLHLLFGGCSNTEGVGANIEDTWSHMLYTEVSKNIKTSGYFNLAKSGSGWHRILQNFMVYTKRYGAPDYFFILMPNILRGFSWDGDKKPERGGGWRYEQINPWGNQEMLKENITKHRLEFPSWLISWYMFISYCESLGTKVIWSTWDDWEVENIKNTKMFEDTFFTIDRVTQEDLAGKYYHLISRKDATEAREGHDGYIQQTAWYEAFLNNAKLKGYLNETN